MDTTVSSADLLKALIQHWSQSHEELAQHYGHLLSKVLETKVGLVTLKNNPPEPAPRYMDDFNRYVHMSATSSADLLLSRDT